ncbi:MAG TPA: M55 family metallopeptidase [Gemmatimonadaceae bacterium]
MTQRLWRALITGASVVLTVGIAATETFAQDSRGNNAGPKVLLVLDMEGVSCVNDPRMVESDPRFASFYSKGVDCLVDDVNAVVDGLFIGGARSVDVLDFHGNGKNMPSDRLDARASLLTGTSRVNAAWQIPASGPYDAVATVGMHDKPLSGGFMAHTLGAGLSPVLNDATLTETELIGYTFGAAGVPLILVSGDDYLRRDLAATMPWIEYVVVKHSTGYATAELLPAAAVHEGLRAGAATAVRALTKMQPLRGTPPFRAGLLATYPGDLPPAGSPFSHLPGIQYRGDTVTFPAGDIKEAQGRMQALIGIATARAGARGTAKYFRARPDAEAAFRVVADSIFEVELAAVENRACALRDSAKARVTPPSSRRRCSTACPWRRFIAW